MEYNDWIDRERRIRIKLLDSSSIILKDHIYRVCKICGEVCLCHEEKCPNCDSDEIISEILENNSSIIGKIRCQHRYKNILNSER